MNNFITLILLTLVGGIIGWVTNILAIKLMFRPIKPIRIPIINFEIVGLIPKRKAEIAENIGEIVSNELLSIDDIINSVIEKEDELSMIESVMNKIRILINSKMDFIPAPFRMMVQGPIDKIIDEEVDGVILEIKDEALDRVREKVDIKSIVEEKINKLDLYKLEEIIIKVAKKELKHIEILGFILGAFIGILQGIILMFIR